MGRRRLSLRIRTSRLRLYRRLKRLISHLAKSRLLKRSISLPSALCCLHQCDETTVESRVDSQVQDPYSNLPVKSDHTRKRSYKDALHDAMRLVIWFLAQRHHHSCRHQGPERASPAIDKEDQTTHQIAPSRLSPERGRRRGRRRG